MYCKKCGSLIQNGSKFCMDCGAPVAQDKESVGIVEATKLFFVRYADFGGRSRRSEYWWASLAIGLIGGMLSVVVPELSGLWSLAILVPSIAICVRRLHDIGKSGWWYLLILIPLVGTILLLIWYCTDSTGDNQWGPNPKC